MAVHKNVGTLGQVFTPEAVVDFMLGGIWNHDGSILEPSCGDGAFWRRLPKGAVGIEVDPAHCPAGALNVDFFAFSDRNKFDVIVGNPPYVRYQDISPETRSLLRTEHFDGRSNLYLFFIEKAVRHLNHHGELVFITPRDFLKATSAVKLNQWLFAHGTITHAVELGDARVFDDAVPNCLIWRYELGDLSHKTWWASIGVGQSINKLTPSWNLAWEQRNFVESAGHLLFPRADFPMRLSDIATVRVGAVSGLDEIYTDPINGNREFVCSETARTKKTRRMIWCDQETGAPPSLVPHRDRLITRKIRKYDQSNWWHWGRGYDQSERPRVYVNSKTRNATPFFCNDCYNYDGSVLAIFPKNPEIDLEFFCQMLNSVDWADLGFVCDGRFLFSQRSLEQAPLPVTFQSFL